MYGGKDGREKRVKCSRKFRFDGCYLRVRHERLLGDQRKTANAFRTGWVINYLKVTPSGTSPGPTTAIRSCPTNTGVHELSRAGITRTDTREALLTAHGGRGAHLVNSEQARLVIDQAPHNAVDAIHTLSLIMAVGPVVAIVPALWLIKPEKAGTN
jgi:hypothetical protein